MFLQLFGARFRQWRCSSLSGCKRDCRVPLPDDAQMPDDIVQREACPWWGPVMSVLTCLRKTNAKGQIVQWLKQRHASAMKAGTTEESVETFARNYKHVW